MRMHLAETAPAAYQAMLGLERYMAASSLPKRTYELVKLRVSQINGCAYCVDMHSHDAKAGGETDERLYAVAVWREAPFFTPAERAALDLAEAATRLPDHGHGVSDEVWKAAAAHYDEAGMAALVVAVTTINAWNRIALATGLVAGSHRQ
ncbi:carboxymuconolactone decarboxylase family protein [Actinokineospora guangxiensis]|uniref:Carboxymuconolactone decarboxylase family protein n=1 Tax=Actinokineospora guangxiensis TaxID=1490288 RepID=A0ABW0EP24_9PSEU